MGRNTLGASATVGFLRAAVKRGLFGRLFAVDDLFDFFGKFRGHRHLGAAQDIGRRLGAQPVVVPIAFVAAQAGGKFFEESGEQELEK